ncbi:MAG: TIGR01459 family HAD-type hydrolase [Gammaproteobacteria bacterium]|nr:TIGR01459 family HAD-type hydrolase [Gammaproteobacteria bacterium]
MHETADAPHGEPRRLIGLSQIADTYDTFLIDAWGVLLDGTEIYPGVVDCLQQLRRAGKRVIVVTNAARRESVVERGMQSLGIGAELYDSVVSSGELTWVALTAPADPWHARLGPNCYYLGPERSRGLLEGTGLTVTDALDRADFVLATGPLGEHEPDIEPYRGLLDRAARLGLPMVCANPDQEAIRSGSRGISAGAIASAYRHQYGGEVRFHGKPHAEIYARACARASVPRERMLAIGDGLATDILGANRAALASVFVAGGIHAIDLSAPDSAARLQALFARYACRPDTTLQRLCW